MSDDADQVTHKAITKTKLLKLVKKITDTKKEVATLQLTLKGAVDDAADAGLHKGALSVITKAEKIRKDKGDAALTEFWFNVDAYRDMLGHNDIQELPGIREEDAEDEDGEEDEADEDDKDLRPRHLRLAGASAADTEH